MTKCLIENIFERYMSYRKDSQEIQNHARQKFYNNYINPPMERSYYSQSDDRKAIATGYLNLFSDILHDESKLLSLIDTQPKFVDDYADRILLALNFKTTFNYPEKFRKMLMKNITKGLYMLMFKDAQDFDMFVDVMYDKVYNNNKNEELSHEEKKARILAEIWDTSNLTDHFEDSILRTMSFKQLMDLMVDPFNVDKKVLSNQTDSYHFYSTFARAVAHHLDSKLSDDSEALKEWETLSDEDKEFLGKMILTYKNRTGGGYENIEAIEFFKKFKSLNILQAFTFKLSSSSDWWKDKSILSNVFAVWYACQKGQVPKYVQNKFGKFKSLLSLYGYNWNKLKAIILKDKDVMEALN